jgi:hypothetical protein
VLERTKTEIVSERPAKKQPLSDEEARALLASVEEVVIAKGKASRRQKASAASLDDLRGPTGNFRAPMLRRGETLLVGFHEGELLSLLA